MKIQEIKWCGEGDLFSRIQLLTHNLLIFSIAKMSKRARNASRGHNLGTRMDAVDN